MKLINKLTLGYLIVSLFFMIVAIVGAVTINNINVAFNELAAENIPVVEALENVKALGLKMGLSSSEFVLIRSESDAINISLKNTEKEQTKLTRKNFDAAISRYEELATKFYPDEKGTVENIKKSGNKFQNTSNAIMALKEQGASGKVVLEKWEEFEEAEEEFLKVIDNAIAHEHDEFAAREQNMEGVFATSVKIIVIVALFALSIAMALGVIISKSISDPIIKLKKAAEDIEKGKMDTRVNIKSSDEVGILSAGFNQMARTLEQNIVERKKAEEIRLENERLAAADKAKSEFLANMSHELRTPLNASIGFSELLKQGVAGELSEKQKRYMNNILTSNQFLLTLINDILDISKIEAGKIELVPEKMSVPITINETLSLIKEKSSRHNVLLKTEFDPELEFIVADKQRFKQVLFNLLSNAVKFSKEEGGTVTITTKKEGDMAKISVSDTGIGIREENIGRLFHKFEQLESGINQKYGGTGLGLAITKQLVELHGGKILAESKYGEGSTFSMRIPVKMEAKT